MSRKYKFLDQEKLHFVSFATIKWIDVFTRSEYSEILLESLRFCQKNKGLEIGAWCIMPNHLHLIIGTNDKPMQNILRDFKSFTSRTLKDEIKNHPRESRRNWIIDIMKKAGLENGNNDSWQFWQQHNHPLELYNNIILNNTLKYLHMNPVAAGYVNEPEYWKYSSAIDYAGGKGLLDISFIE